MSNVKSARAANFQFSIFNFQFSISFPFWHCKDTTFPLRFTNVLAIIFDERRKIFMSLKWSQPYSGKDKKRARLLTYNLLTSDIYILRFSWNGNFILYIIYIIIIIYIIYNISYNFNTYPSTSSSHPHSFLHPYPSDFEKPKCPKWVSCKWVTSYQVSSRMAASFSRHFQFIYWYALAPIVK